MLEYQLPFVQALRMGTKMRRRMFEAIEQGHEPEFWGSAVGKGVYGDLLSAVRESGVPEAVEEFEERFLPFVTAKHAPRHSKDEDAEEMPVPGTSREDRRARSWPAILAICLVAVTAAMIGINVVRTAAKAPQLPQASSTAVQPGADRAQTVPEPAQARQTQEIADSAITGSVSAITPEPEPAVSSEESPSSD